MAFVILFLGLGGAASADKTLEPWAQTGIIELAAGEGIGPITFSPDSSTLAASVRDPGGTHSARIWSAETGLTLGTLATPFNALVEHPFTPVGDRVYAHTDTTFRAWTVDDGARSSGFVFDGVHATNDVAFFSGHFLAAKQFGGAEFWSDTGVKVTFAGLDAMRPYQEIIVTDSDLLYLKSAGFTLHMDLAGFDPATMDLIDADGSFGPYAPLLATTASGDMIATYPEVDGDGLSTATEPTVRIWQNVPTWTPDATPLTAITGFDGDIIAAEFSEDDTQLLTRSNTGVVALWRVSDGALITTTTAPADVITGALLTKTGGIVLSYSSGSAALLDPAMGALVQTFPAPASNIALSPDGTKMITYAVGASPARIWHLITE
ncbi:MAG: hypothetical protein AAFY25_07840 [Pseudomonadota bacterium]